MWPSGTQQSGVHVIDLTAPIAAADQQAGFHVLAPAGLSSQWRPTSTDFVPASGGARASFRIGFVSPSSQYAELLESDDAPDAVAAQYGPLTADGSVSVVSAAAPAAGASGSARAASPITTSATAGTATVPWTAFRRPDGEQLLEHTFGAVTVIVTGSASQDELVQLAASVH